MSSTLIVYFLTIGFLLPPIVIFSFLLCGLASLDSNHPSFFPFFVWLLAFPLLPFRFFAFVIMRLPKTISLQVGRKLADKTKDEIMTEVLRVFADLDVKTVQVAYEVVRVIFASPHFPPLASSSQSAEASVSRDSSDSQLLKDNELDLLQSQSILQDLVPLSGDSSDTESNQRASKAVGKTRAHLPKGVICSKP